MEIKILFNLIKKIIIKKIIIKKLCCKKEHLLHSTPGGGGEWGVGGGVVMGGWGNQKQD